MNNNNNNTTELTYTVVSVPSSGRNWGWFVEIRIHRADVDPKGRGYRDRCEMVWGDYDGRNSGPRSRLGKALAKAKAYCAEANQR